MHHKKPGLEYSPLPWGLCEAVETAPGQPVEGRQVDSVSRSAAVELRRKQKQDSGDESLWRQDAKGSKTRESV